MNLPENDLPSDQPIFSGTWVNERGSRMILDQQGATVRGSYVTQIGNDKVVRQEHPIIGFANGTSIGFVVSWPAALSLTSWVGRLEFDAHSKPKLHTMWHLVRPASESDPSKPLQIWESFLTNSSVFERVNE